VLTPSDDPAAAGQHLLLQAATQSNAQERLNAEAARSGVNGSGQPAPAGLDAPPAARDPPSRRLSLGASPSSAIPPEILSIRDQIVAVANSRAAGPAPVPGFSASAAVTQVAGV